MVNEKVLDLANHISRKKRGSKSEIKYGDPEYMILEPVVTDEMADVCMTMAIKEKVTPAEIAKRANISEEDAHRILLELADAGVCFVNEIDGVDTFWYDTWVPGIMEMMVNNKKNVEKYPQIAEAFEAYGRVRGKNTIGKTPVGVGLMRVIPIETAISGETRRASYEEVSKYLNEHTLFSVSDCSCRTAREAMGEGCGHLKEDMCIQMGHAAEYYIRTGRGRKITREEAFEIIERAEANGLMHQIPNLDGSGTTHAICNCCGCSCFALRTAEMYLNVDMVRSNYVAKVDKEKCVACGECVVNCPVNALQLGQKICSTGEIVEELVRDETPRDTEWGEEKWNEDFRINRKNVVETGTSPCKTECPAHIGVQGYIKLASQGKYQEALELIKIENPFPAVCGRICPHGCETECTRGEMDEPIAIDEIKKFIAEQELKSEHRFVPRVKNHFDIKVAVIGAGPAGLSCAYYLAVEGYKVTVFEKEEKLGGMLTLGIPAFRLEKNIIESEIEILKDLGVNFKTGINVGSDITLAKLRAEGFKAFYLGIGAQGGRKLNILGEDGENVITGIDFLRSINLGKGKSLEGDTIVIGGGNVAIDVARSATRVGEGKVKMFCLESREEMPALEEEIEEALQENIEIINGWGPKEIVLENGKAKAVVFKKVISVFDDQGKFNPTYDENETVTIEATNILVSVGQTIEWGNLYSGEQLKIQPNGTVMADGFTYQTDAPDIFVGGDVYTGPKYAIDAIAAGKQGAISIHRFVHKGQSLVYGRDRREYKSLDKQSIDWQGYDNMPRQRAGHSDVNLVKEKFADHRKTFTEEQMKKETERCLGCGATIVDEFLCVGCGQCTTKCKFDAIKLVKRYDGEGVAFEKIKPVIVKQVIKRKFKITAKNIKNAFHRKG